MSDQRIILATDSRLLREMLNRILRKAEHLEIVQQVADHENLPALIQELDVEWVILTMPADDKTPDWTDAYIREHPFVRIMSVSPDGGQVKMKWLDKREQDIINPSLQDLINILESNPSIEKVDTLQEVV
jgi:DNA-binding NarL/FixJ family response regulator